ncbi:sigma-70 family RNA polymerase sigma factor [Streptomyces sp. NPDC060194]|uniref:sigma-70 family RNA polymerase sigma factor n=1 Tax=Streptomyces sp. NPDC060194 TaxID=3347069 RepID=UPI00365BD9BC
MRHDRADRADTFPDRRTVEAAQDGDSGAVERLSAGSLPLVYNIVGRAAESDLDVDDIVQDTMVAVIRALPELREAGKFRSWLVAIAVRQLTDARRRARSGRLTTLEHADERHAPEPDFATLFLLRQSLTAEQRQVAAATAWLDPSYRDLLSLWWLEACGRLSRKDIAAATKVPTAHLAVQVQRMKTQLDVARTVVRALSREPRCAELVDVAGAGAPSPSPLLRKRIARHLRGCDVCGTATGRLVAPERLLAGLPLLLPGRTGEQGAAGASGWAGQPAPDASPLPADTGGWTSPGADQAGGWASPDAAGRPFETASHWQAPRGRGLRSARPRGDHGVLTGVSAKVTAATVGAGVAALVASVVVALPSGSASDARDTAAQVTPSAQAPATPSSPAPVVPVKSPAPIRTPAPVEAPVMRTSLPAKDPAPTLFVSAAGNDSNPGTSAGSPFRTIQRAADVAKPGDVVAVMNGTYSEPRKGSNVLTVKRSGRAGAPITFTAYAGHHPVIHPKQGWNGISVYGASHIVVKGLDVKGNNAALSLADAERTYSKTDPTYNTNCISVEKNRESGAFPHHVEITGNTVHDCAGGGINAIEADHVDITENHVYGNAWYTVYGASGISVLTPRDTTAGDSRTYKIRITRNRVHDNETMVKWEGCRCYSDGNGIIVDTTKGDPAKGRPAYNGRILVAGNVSYDNGGSGIHSYKSRYVDIVNNTAYLNGRSKRMEAPYANIFANSSTDVRLLNNISYGRPGQSTNSRSRNENVRYDYNVYFGGKAPESRGAHDVIADPKLTDPGKDAGADFHLAQGSPAIGSGTPLAGVARGGAPDRGAYGFAAGAPAASGSSDSGSGSDSGTPGGDDAGKDEDTGSGNPSGGESPAAGSGEEIDGEGATAGSTAGGESGVTPDGGGSDSQPLAETGGSDPALPLGIAGAVLVVGAGLIALARRKRRS